MLNNYNPTEALTPEQIDQQIRDLSEQKRRLTEESYNNELSAPTVPPTQKSISVSKTIINITFIVVGLTGIVGSFITSFNMDKYTQFLQQYGNLWAPLVIAVGSGRAFKSYVNKKYGDNNK